MSRHLTIFILIILASLASATGPGGIIALAQNPVVTTHAEVPPPELADPIEAVLATGGQRIVVHGSAVDFWWVKSLPLISVTMERDWSAVEEGTLVGAVRLSTAYPEIRGRTVKAGVYTLRLGFEPQNGDHLGVSRYREFLLLSPQALDSSAAALDHDGVIALSRAATGLSHPAAWSLDPPVASGPALSIQRNDAGQTSVVFEVPISRDGRDVGTLKFGVILVGAIQS